MTKHGFGMMDMYRSIRGRRLLVKFDIAGMRLRSMRPQVADEGYHELMENPPTLETIGAFFTKELDAQETQIAQGDCMKACMK